jgi:hypothetical protein
MHDNSDQESSLGQEKSKPEVIKLGLDLHARQVTECRQLDGSTLESGDVVVWGGPSRLAFHGVDTLAKGDHPLTGPYRLNLTFRKALD